MRKLFRFAILVLSLPACSPSSGGASPTSTQDAAPFGDANTADTATTQTLDGAPLADDAGAIAVASLSGIDLAVAQETTVCVTKRLGNTEPLAVSGFSATLAPGSHHLIVYASTDTQESLTPQECMPFSGITQRTAKPIAIINREQVDWSFPTGVALEVPANQMVRVEGHYINTSSVPIKGSGAIAFHGSAKATAPAYQPADFFFWGTLHIQIPPNATSTTGLQFQTGIANTNLLSITTHQHRLGAGIRVWEGASPLDMATPIANDSSWANPAWTPLAPGFALDGTNGLTYQCDWNNTTSSMVSFGESALDEMCFIMGYYYPARGFDFCFDHTCPQRIASAGDAAAE